jgi:hypothetical protein
VSANRLTVMPAYWFLYNLYALARNASKYADRDKRTKKIQRIEYDFLAPDSINEIFTALDLLKKFTAKAQDKNLGGDTPEDVLLQAGQVILEDVRADMSALTVQAPGFENSNRPVVLLKVRESYQIYRNLIVYYGIMRLIDFIENHRIGKWEDLQAALPQKPVRFSWQNIGGQLLPRQSVDTLLEEIRNNTIEGWDAVHEFYQQNSRLYEEQKLQHAYASLLELLALSPTDFTAERFKALLYQAIDTKEWMVKNIFESRAKDYQNEFRKMVYDNEKEMENVVGRLDDNAFIAQQREAFIRLRASVERILKFL